MAKYSRTGRHLDLWFPSPNYMKGYTASTKKNAFLVPFMYFDVVMYLVAIHTSIRYHALQKNYGFLTLDVKEHYTQKCYAKPSQVLLVENFWGLIIMLSLANAQKTRGQFQTIRCKLKNHGQSWLLIQKKVDWHVWNHRCLYYNYTSALFLLIGNTV